MNNAVHLSIPIILCFLLSSAFGEDRSDGFDADAERAVALAEYQLAKSYMRLADAQPPFREVTEGSGAEIKAKVSVNFSKAITKYRDEALKDDQHIPPRTPQVLFRSAIQRTHQLVMADHSVRNKELLRDMVSDYVEAQTMLGNAAFLEAFASRFPRNEKSTVPPKATKGVKAGDRSSLEAALLIYADQEFRHANDAISLLLQLPSTIREGNEFGLVEAPNDQRKQRPSEFKLAILASDRVTRTRLANAKRRFLDSAYGKGKDEASERESARGEFQAAAHESYLMTATMAANSEDSGAMTRGGAGDLKSTLADAQQGVFEISHGLKPRALPRSYVPEKDAALIFAEAKADVASAIEAERTLKAENQQYLVSIDRLRQELQSQRDRFATPLRDLTGIEVTVPVLVKNADGSDRQFFIVHADKIKAAAERRALGHFLRDRVSNSMRQFATSLVESQLLSIDELQSSTGDANPLSGTWQDLATTTVQTQPVGQIGQQLLQIREAQLVLLQQRKALKDFAERIRIEWDYANEVVMIVEGGQKKIADNLWWSRMADSVSVSYNFPKVSVSIQPFAMMSADRQKENTLINMRIQNDSLKAETKRRVEQLLLDQMQSYYEVQKAAIRLAKEHAALQSQLAQIDWLIESWAQSREEASTVFEQYPAFLMYRDEAEVKAEKAFNIALEKCYNAARALEYQWTESFQNPVRGRAKDITLSGYEQFTKTDSLLGARTANDLKLFLDALVAWHNELYRQRGGAGGERPKIISVREQILGLTAENKDKAAFTKWIREHLIFEGDKPVGLLFQFSTAGDFLKPMDDYSTLLFPAREWNQKISSIAVRIDGDRHYNPKNEGELPQVELVPGGISFVRRFPADGDVFETYDLRGLGPESSEGFRLKMMLGKKPDIDSYRAYMKIPARTNQEFVYYSYTRKDDFEAAKRREDRIGVACTTWTFLIDRKYEPANFGLDFEQIRDIRIAINYVYNRDPDWVKLP